MTTPDTADVLDRLVGAVPGSALDALRRERPETKRNVQASYEALFAPERGGEVSRLERLALASFVALLHGESPEAAHYEGLLAAEPEGKPLAAAIRKQAEAARTRGPYGAYPPGPLSREDLPGPLYRVPEADRAALGPRIVAAIEHAHRLVFHLRDAKAEDLAELLDAGWSTAGIVTLSQLVAFLAFQLRAAHGLRVLGA